MPNEVALPEEPSKNEFEVGSDDKGKGRKNSRGQRKKVAKVCLREEVVAVCQEVIDSKYPAIAYDYASLFMGNQKQLLVYRRCS